MVVACGGVFVGHKAVSQCERYCADALAYRAQAEDLKGRLAIAKGQLADAERRIAEAQKGLTKKERQILAESLAGRPGTVSRRNGSWFNVKKLSGGRKWRGEIGIDEQKHVIFSAPEYSVRAGALTLRSYYMVHKLDTIEKIVKRYSTSNHDEYISYLCAKMKLKPDESFDVIRRLPELLKGIAYFETGKPIPDKMLATLDILGKI
jgi:hypothetical protein